MTKLGSSPPTARVAVITGGSQGLGRALAEALAARGWSLVLDARRADRLEPVVQALSAQSRVIGVVGDVTDSAHRAALAHAAQELGQGGVGRSVQVVVNNASTLGASPLPELRDIDPTVLQRIFDVNVVAPVALVQALDAHLAEGATVVNITSDAGVEAYETWGGYGASKAALEHVSRVLAEERPELRVLVVDPGDIRTEMHQDAFPGQDISDRPEPEAVVPAIVTLIEGEQPSGRYQAEAVEARVAEPVQ